MSNDEPEINYYMDGMSVKFAETINTVFAEMPHEERLALLYLTGAAMVARYNDELDLGKDFLPEDRRRAGQAVTYSLDVAHWLTPRAGFRDRLFENTPLRGPDDPDNQDDD